MRDERETQQEANVALDLSTVDYSKMINFCKKILH